MWGVAQPGGVSSVGFPEGLPPPFSFFCHGSWGRKNESPRHFFPNHFNYPLPVTCSILNPRHCIDKGVSVVCEFSAVCRSVSLSLSSSVLFTSPGKLVLWLSLSFLYLFIIQQILPVRFLFLS